MKHAALARHIGRQYLLDIGEGLTIPVRVLDVRTRWTWTELCVTPEGGTGTVWLPLSGLTEVLPTLDPEESDDVPRSPAPPVGRRPLALHAPGERVAVPRSVTD